MKFLFLFPIFCLCLSSAVGQGLDTIPRKEINIHKVSSAPKIDGSLEDLVWKEAPIATNFVERVPNNGRPAPDSMKTEVKIIYDDLGIYFGAMMHDPQPEQISRELTERDNIANDDFFFILLNGYNDRQQSLQFIVTAAGVQYDAKMTNMNEDPSWNGIWYSEIAITDSGWVAEIFIPYSELRFPKKKVQTWGLNMEREVRRTGSRYTWSPIDISKGSFSIYDGEIHGIENINTPTRLSFQPYLTTYLNDYDGNSEILVNGGMDLKYGISEAFTLDMILIPDFGQTRFDEAVLNLSASEVQYDEQRAFFTEGTELFSKGDLFYSRRVGGAPNFLPVLEEGEQVVEYPTSVDLLNAMKISGRTDAGLGIGIFNAVTEKTFAKVEETTTGETKDVLVSPLTNYNVLVFDQRFGDNSSVSLVNTNVTREGRFRDANATGVYTNLTNKNNSMDYWIHLEGSWVLEEQTKFGTEGRIGMSGSKGKHRFSTEAEIRTRDYDINDIGYSDFSNYADYMAYYGYRYLKPKGFLNNLYLNFNLVHKRRLEPDLFSNFVFNFNSQFTTRDFFTFGGGFETTPFGTQDIYEPRIDGRHVDIPTYYDQWLWFSTDRRKKFSLEAVADWYKYDERGRGRLIFDFVPIFRISDKFNLQLRSNAIFSDKEEGFVTLQGNNIIFGQRDRDTFVNSLQAAYIFNNKMSLNLAFRHYFSNVAYADFYTLEENGELLELPSYTENHNTTYNSWNVDLRYSWWFAPGSQLTLLYRNAIDSFDNSTDITFDRNFEYLFNQPQLNSLSLRLSYYLDYNRIKNWFKPTLAATAEDGMRNRKMGR